MPEGSSDPEVAAPVDFYCMAPSEVRVSHRIALRLPSSKVTADWDRASSRQPSQVPHVGHVTQHVCFFVLFFGGGGGGTPTDPRVTSLWRDDAFYNVL